MAIKGSLPGGKQLTIRNKFGIISLQRPERESNYRRSGSKLRIIPPSTSAIRKADRQLGEKPDAVIDNSSRQEDIKIKV